MYPILCSWNGFVVPSWHFFYFLAAVVSFYVWEYFRKAYDSDIPSHAVQRVYVISYIGSYIGARFLSELVERRILQKFVPNESLWVGSMTFYGGLFGAIFFGTAGAIYWKLPAKRLLDGGAVAGLCGLAIGRIGCFLNGDDYGLPVDISHGIPWWSVTFPNHATPIPRIPIQLLESFSVFLLSFLLALNFRTLRERIGPGGIGRVSLSSYAVLRFILEIYRDDERGSLLGFSTSQTLSLGLLGLIVLWHWADNYFVPGPKPKVHAG